VNFLAHCALAAAHDDLMVGGFLGDFVKGPVPTNLPALVGQGIRLHRRIDAFSNSEPSIRTSVARLPKAYRRLAPPFVDLLADHLLASAFTDHHGADLEVFTARVYGALDQRDAALNARARRYFEFMRDTDLFDRYRDLAAVEQAFARIALRLGRPEAVLPFMAAVAADYDGFTADFSRYYPALVSHADAWIRAHLN
jgi:acyl carrier protein phosphodiesterase